MTPSAGSADALGELRRTRAVAVVRAPELPDAVALVETLRDSRLPVVELTFTIPGLGRHLAAATGVEGAVVGAGTVLTEADAAVALDAGARFLVTPALLPETPVVVARARQAGVPVLVGALTPSEVGTAHQLGADAVKIFPASAVGPDYLRELAGPFPGIPLLPSGGVDAESAPAWLEAGAFAVSLGGSLVPAAAVASGDWAAVGERAASLVRALSTAPLS